jgi:2-amino-4-hydroxy-6-hydroxymethyldihydropteridine diphosphokinase/dihydropteroate synthase
MSTKGSHSSTKRACEVEVAVSIGANLGQRFSSIRKALHLLQNILSGFRSSVIFETKALLPPNAPADWDLPYLNLVVAGTTSVEPHALLSCLKAIEADIGRDFSVPRWAPRIIDLDLLAYGDQVLSSPTLTLPHPELLHRPFLLSLMATLLPYWRYPVPDLPMSGLTLQEIAHHHISYEPPPSSCFTPSPQIVGILNVTPDSFSDGGSYFSPESALARFMELAHQGAAVIDIGAQSTRPQAQLLSPEEEWSRLKPFLTLLSKSKLSQSPQISLDTFYPEVMEKALHYISIDWINDMKGDEGMLPFLAQTKCKIVATHALSLPPSTQRVLSFSEPPQAALIRWGKEKLDQLAAWGIGPDRVILDPGIGFGKSALQSLALLNGIEPLKELGCEVLVGHSRKSFLKIATSSVERDMETVGLSHFLSQKGINYLRVHNVEAHQRSLSAFHLVLKTEVVLNR